MREHRDVGQQQEDNGGTEEHPEDTVGDGVDGNQLQAQHQGGNRWR